MPEETQLFLAEDFVISCGCVVFIPSTSQIVLVKSLSATQSGSWLLPKGRKNVGETLEAAAVREAFEETGCECELLPCVLGTRATDSAVLGRVRDVVRNTSCTEPIAVQMRQTRHGHQKMIFWFIGKMKDGCTPQPLEEHEHYEVGFFGYDEAIVQLRWDHDREIVRKAVQIVRAQSNPPAITSVPVMKAAKSTMIITNGQTNGLTNAQSNGQSNGSNGKSNGSNGKSDGSNGKTNGSNNKTNRSNCQSNGQSNVQLNGQSNGQHTKAL